MVFFVQVELTGFLNLKKGPAFWGYRPSVPRSCSDVVSFGTSVEKKKEA